MSSPSPSQPNTYQNPPTVAIFDISNNDDGSPLTETESESESSSNLHSTVEVKTEASTVDPSMAIRRTSSEFFILKGGTLKLRMRCDNSSKCIIRRHVRHMHIACYANQIRKDTFHEQFREAYTKTSQQRICKYYES